MTTSNRAIDRECRELDRLLSDYVDNTLAAREVWDVEKHLAGCARCTAVSNEMRQTVTLLRSAEAYDTGADFMAKLHARLDGVEAAVSADRRSPITRMRDWLAGLSDGLYARRVPALSLGMATLAMAIVFAALKPAPISSPPPSDTAALVPQQVNLSRHVAMTASNPFDDPIAAKLEADDRSGSDVGHTEAD